MEEWVSPIMSDETIGSSVYDNISLKSSYAACFSVLLISSLVTSFSNVTTKSIMEPSLTGTLKAMPSNFTFSSGITSMDFVPPVVVGIIDSTADLALLRSL